MISPEAEKIMNERFGKDSIIALATVNDGMPAVRNVDAIMTAVRFTSSPTLYPIKCGRLKTTAM